MGAKIFENRDRRAKAFSTGVSILCFILGSFFLLLWRSLADLGSLSGLREVLLGGLCIQKSKVFEKAAFWFFVASDCPFGFVLAVSCAILVPERVPIWVAKVVKNVV